MKSYAKWLVLSHALCLALGGLVFWLLIARPGSAADADTIAKLRATATELERKLAESDAALGLLDERLIQTDEQLQNVTDALGRAIGEVKYWRANYTKVRGELKALGDLIASGASGTTDSQGTVNEIKDTVQRSIGIVEQLQNAERGGGP